MKLHAFGIFLLSAGCAAEVPVDNNSDDDADADAGDDAGAQSRAPRLELRLTDAPGDFEKVWVNIARVDIDAGGSWLSLTQDPQRFDLLTLQNDVTAAMGASSLAPGTYGQLRLIVDTASVVVDGQEHPLKIASGAQTGIKINLDATLEENMTYALTLDFDAAKSVKSTGQGYLMTPVISVKRLEGTETSPDAEAPPEAEAPPDETPPEGETPPETPPEPTEPLE